MPAPTDLPTDFAPLIIHASYGVSVGVLVFFALVSFVRLVAVRKRWQAPEGR